MKYSLCILKNKKSFQKTQMSFQKNIEHQIFLDPQLQLLRVFGYHLTIQSLTSRKRYAQKHLDVALKPYQIMKEK